MGFYSEIAMYYDMIFPAEQAQIDFLSKAVGKPEAHILDVACGTGEYSIALAKRGFHVVGTDISGEMIELAQQKANEQNLQIHFVQKDMLRISTLSADFEPFDMVFCIGNSLVHLDNLDKIRGAIAAMRRLMKKEGILVLQMINYDNILKNRITSLPALSHEDKGITFERRYEHDSVNNMILFHTALNVQGKKEPIRNTVSLYPMYASQLKMVLMEDAFTDIKFYGGFDGSQYHSDAFLMIVTAVAK